MTTKRTERDPDFYATGGWGYTDRNGARHQIWQWMADFGLEPGTRLLDAGCGDGWWTSLFAEAGFKVVGVDRSTDAIATATVQHPGPIYMTANMLDWPLDFPFQTVFSRGISPTGRPSSTEAAAIMDAMAACLKPGGTLVVVRATNGSGIPCLSTVSSQTANNPKVSELVEMVERIAQVFKVTFDGSMAAIGGRKT